MDPLTLMVLIAAGLAAVSLFNGITSMAHGGEFDDLHAHEMMFKRVGWQALAALLIFLGLLAGLD